ncbi:uncharacterized protein [Porites lutea]|uniref:uncharacterized protein n=1 Tax=Porites lutea TaxID=51062 RepID=UPI003CC60742
MAAKEDGGESRIGDLSFYDPYGFAVYKPGSELADEDCRSHEYSFNSDNGCSKAKEYWMKTIKNWEEHQIFSPKQLRRYIKQGIPIDMRGKVWNKMIGSQAIRVISAFDYQITLAEIRQLLVDLGVSEYGGVNSISRLGQIVVSLIENNKENMIDSPDTLIMTRQWKRKLHKQITVFRQIMLDVDRSFPRHKMFIQGTSEGKEGRAALFRVLAVYALYNPEVSYCQGMSYIAGMFLMNMEEEDAFWCLVSILERPKYLAGYFSDSLGKIQRHAAVFERLMRQRRSKLYKHLEALGVSPLMFLTPWFMALFTSLPCWDAVLIMWDLLLLDGMSVIFQVALALLDALSAEILPLKEIAHVLPVLLRPPAKLVTRDALVQAIWKVKPIQKWEIESIQAVLDEEKEEQAKTKKRRLNDQNEDQRRKRQRTMSNQLQQENTEPSLFQRVIGLFSSKQESEIQFSTNDIEMTTFKVVTGQSPNMLPTMCCSAANSLLNTPRRRGSPGRRPFSQNRRHRNSPSRRGSNNEKDLLKRRHVVHKRIVSSPVRRSRRLAGRRTPVGVGVTGHSPKSLVRSSARNHHAFKLFNTPTPLRGSQVRPLRHQSPSSSVPDPSPMSVTCPGTSMSPDVEMISLGPAEKKLDFTES